MCGKYFCVFCACGTQTACRMQPLQKMGSPSATHQLIISSVQLMTYPAYGKCK